MNPIKKTKMSTLFWYDQLSSKMKQIFEIRESLNTDYSKTVSEMYDYDPNIFCEIYEQHIYQHNNTIEHDNEYLNIKDMDEHDKVIWFTEIYHKALSHLKLKYCNHLDGEFQSVIVKLVDLHFTEDIFFQNLMNPYNFNEVFSYFDEHQMNYKDIRISIEYVNEFASFYKQCIIRPVIEISDRCGLTVNIYDTLEELDNLCLTHMNWNRV